MEEVFVKIKSIINHVDLMDNIGRQETFSIHTLPITSIFMEELVELCIEYDAIVFFPVLMKKEHSITNGWL